MKTKLLLVILLCIPFLGIGQDDVNVEKTIQKIRANYHQIYNFAQINLRGNSTFDKAKFLKDIDEMERYFQSIEKILNQNNLTGAIQFGLIGNEARNSNQYTIETGMEANFGVYPLQIKAKTNLQTQINNGSFNETLSVVNISADYHPFDNTIFESYAFVKRTRNVFLGVQQRYEVGGGIIVNFYSSNNDSEDITGTTRKGQKLLKELSKWKEKYPEDELKDKHFYSCTEKFCEQKKLATTEEIKALLAEQEKFKKTIKISHSKHRIAFLLGINNEIERTQDNLQLYQGQDSIATKNFPATTIFRLVLAPKYELRGTNFTWKNTLYGKIRVAGDSDRIYDNSEVLINPNDQIIISDESDFWIHYQSDFEFKLSKVISFTASINYVYDNAPKRSFFLDNNNISQIAVADQRYLGTSFKLKYSF